MSIAVRPNDEMIIGIILDADKKSFSILVENKRITVDRSVYEKPLYKGLWIAFVINDDVPENIIPMASKLSTEVKDDEVQIKCRVAIPDGRPNFQYDQAPSGFVWSPEFEWVYDPRRRLNRERQCFANKLYDGTVKLMDKSMIVPNYKNFAQFELVEIEGESENSLDICDAPWYMDDLTFYGVPTSNAAMQLRGDSYQKINVNQIYNGVIVISKRNLKREEYDYYVWGKETGHCHINDRVYSRTGQSHSPVFQVGDWVRYNIKSYNGYYQANKVVPLQRTPRRVKPFQIHNGESIEVLARIRLPREGEKTSVDDYLGTVDCGIIRQLLNDKGYYPKDIHENRSVYCWCEYTRDAQTIHWSCKTLRDPPFDDNEDINSVELTKAIDLIQF